MFLDIYNMVKEILGVLPVELEYLYGICTIFVFVMVVYCLIWPWKWLFGGK